MERLILHRRKSLFNISVLGPENSEDAFVNIQEVNHT